MSHTVTVRMIADQEITVGGKEVNIYDIRTIVVDSHGQIIECCFIAEAYRQAVEMSQEKASGAKE